MKNQIFLILLFISIVSLLTAQDLPKGTIQCDANEIIWKDAIMPIPPGVKIAVLEGSPKESGIFTVRFLFPPNYRLPIHFHPKDERVTVISGSVFVGFGKEFKEGEAKKFLPGDYYVNPADAYHYVFTKEDSCVIQITGIGPWEIHFAEDEK